MSLETMRVHVETRLNTLFPATYPNTPIYFENVPFTEDRTLDAFLAVWILHAGSMQANIGTTSVDRHMGEVRLGYFLKENMGTKKMNVELQFVAGLFKKQQFTLTDNAYVTYQTANFITMPKQRGYMHRQARISFVRNEPPD